MNNKDFIITEKDRVISELKTEIVMLKEYVIELERRLDLDSWTSSKPPSSDGLRKKLSPKSLRPRSKKLSGGQKKHPGSTRLQVENPDKIICHEVSRGALTVMPM